jgi:hypothetical protein
MTVELGTQAGGSNGGSRRNLRHELFASAGPGETHHRRPRSSIVPGGAQGNALGAHREGACYVVPTSETGRREVRRCIFFAAFSSATA